MWAFSCATTAVVWCLLCSEIKSMPGPGKTSDGKMLLITTSMPTTMPSDDMTAKEINKGMDEMMMLADTKMKGDMKAACPPSPPSLLAAEMYCGQQYAMIMANLTGMPSMMNETSGEIMKTEELMKPSSMMMTTMKSCSFQCILQTLGVLDDEGMPHEEKFIQWLMNNTMDHSETIVLQEKASKCFMSVHDHMSNMTVSKTMPSNDDKSSNMEADTKMMAKEQEDMTTSTKDDTMATKQDDMMAVKTTDGMMIPITRHEDMECYFATALIACFEKDQMCPLFSKDAAA